MTKVALAHRLADQLTQIASKSFSQKETLTGLRRKERLIVFLKPNNEEWLDELVQPSNELVQRLTELIQPLNEFISCLNELVQSLNKLILPLTEFIQPLNELT